MSAIPRGGSAVMASRVEPPDALDDFPTPPWATRALFDVVLRRLGIGYLGTMWEPACGRGLMASVMREQVANAGAVFASDVFDYGYGDVGSFVGDGLDVIAAPTEFDAIITNPPFRLAVEFFERAISESEIVALLMRSAWAEGCERYERVFAKHPPLTIAQFCERVPMVKGRWDPDASTATAYAWFVWVRGSSLPTEFMWIPPGQRQRLTRPDDVARFTA